MEVERSSLLITGGAGSFGGAFVKKVLTFNPKIIRVIDNNELAIVEMQRIIKDPRVRYIFADIRDKERLRQIMSGIDIVVHAAALKHVPICEYNPSEAIRTNVDGSLNVVEVAIEKGVRKVLGISSDKAVHPINTYGATKLVMERLFLEANTYTQTKMSCCRFGNFWGSKGSVLALWSEQRAKGEAITMTDGEMSRFWINTDEAVQFALESIDHMQGGEIFIPLMPQHTLKELASNIDPNVKINIIGKRRGEKKTEELYSEDEERYITRTENSIVIRFDK